MSRKAAVADTAPRSAVSAQLAEMNAEAPIAVPGNAILWRVIVEPLEPPQTMGRFAAPKEVLDAEEILTSVGKVVQLGSMAFKATTQAGLKLTEEPHVPKVGDYVLFQQYAGQEIAFRDSKKKLRVLNDTEILMVMNEQQARTIKAYL